MLNFKFHFLKQKFTVKNYRFNNFELEKYNLYLLGVAYLLTTIGKIFDPVTLAAAYLHDTVEGIFKRVNQNCIKTQIFEKKTLQ